MKLFSHIMLNLLLSTMVFSTFAGSKSTEYLNNAKAWLTGHQRDLTVGSGSAAAGALLMYLASNETVKGYAGRTSTAVSNYTKAKYRAFVNYWNSLSKSKKIAAGSVAGAGVTAAYIYFEGPGVNWAKAKYNAKPNSN